MTREVDYYTVDEAARILGMSPAPLMSRSTHRNFYIGLPHHRSR